MPNETPDQLAQALAAYKTLERKHLELKSAYAELEGEVADLEADVDRLMDELSVAQEQL